MATTSIGAPGVVFPDATVQASAANTNVVTRIYSASSPWTKPATLKAVKVTMVAGGGGGGGGSGGTGGVNGGSGGNGGIFYGFAQAPAIPGPLTVTVGTGGGGGTAGTPAGGDGGAGTGGGTTSFGTLYSTTGGAGGGGGTSTTGATGASGGSFSITSTATSSSLQLTNPVMAGLHGYGSIPTAGYGAGGSGGGFRAVGGSGTTGFVIVEEFY